MAGLAESGHDTYQTHVASGVRTSKKGGPYGEHNLAYQEYPPKTVILAHVPSRSVCPWDIKK